MPSSWMFKSFLFVPSEITTKEFSIEDKTSFLKGQKCAWRINPRVVVWQELCMDTARSEAEVPLRHNWKWWRPGWSAFSYLKLSVEFGAKTNLPGLTPVIGFPPNWIVVYIMVSTAREQEGIDVVDRAPLFPTAQKIPGFNTFQT